MTTLTLRRVPTPPGQPDAFLGFEGVTDADRAELRRLMNVDAVVRVEEIVRIAGAVGVRVTFEPNETPAAERWTLTLDRYQRDNLLWALLASGFWTGKPVEPFHLLQTGDWIGELVWKLNPSGAPWQGGVTDLGRPNIDNDELRRRVESWLEHRKQES